MNRGAIVVQLVQRPVPVLKAQVLQSESGRVNFYGSITVITSAALAELPDADDIQWGRDRFTAEETEKNKKDL